MSQAIYPRRPALSNPARAVRGGAGKKYLKTFVCENKCVYKSDIISLKIKQYEIYSTLMCLQDRKTQTFAKKYIR